MRTPLAARRAALLAITLVAALLVIADAWAQTPDLARLKAQEVAFQQEAASLAQALESQVLENQRLAVALASPDQMSGAISFETLRQAQFAVDIAATRLLTLDHRISEQAARIAELNAEIRAASGELRGAGNATLAAVVSEARLEWLGRMRAAAMAIEERLRRYRAASADFLALRQEELAIAQRLIALEALGGEAGVDRTPIVEALRALVTELSQRALSLSNAAGTIDDPSPAAVRRRNLLSLRADEALLRSNTRLTDVTIVEAGDLVARLEPLFVEPSVPIRLFEDAVAALDKAFAALGERSVTTLQNRDALSDFERVLEALGEEETGAAELSQRVSGLRLLIRTQLSEIDELRTRIAETRERLIRQRTRLERERLLQREVTRTDRNARERIAAEMAQLPQELGVIYGGRMAEVRTALQSATQSRLALFGGAVVVALLLTVWLRQSLLKRFISAEATRATEVPLEVLRRNLFWLLPVGLWAIFTELFAITEATAISIYPLLLIPAAAASLRDLTQVIVSRRAAGSQRNIGATITRLTEIAMSLTALVVFAYVVLGEVPLLPSTQSAINRLAYSVFVLAGLPMLLFVFFFAASMEPGRGNRIRSLVAALLSLLPPAALIATGVVGLSGYTRLASLMLEDLAAAIVIITALALALGIINDVLEGVAARIRHEDPARAYFVNANFLDPLFRIAQVALVIVAGAVAWAWFDWTLETPVIAEIVAIWRQPLFAAGDTTYRIGSVLVALAALTFVFWAAAWSRRVTYTVVLRKLKDIGIRQSLSVFSQYVVIVLGVLLTLSAVGFDVTTLTVFAASLGVGIGFGLQNVVNNFISGLILLVERPLRLGDIVTVGTNSGTVSQIGIRSMRMRTFDEFDLLVPNSQLISETFTNWTRTNTLMRVLLTVGIGYDDDPLEAVAVVSAVLEENENVVASPAYDVTVDEFGDSSVNLRVCYYVDLRGGVSPFRIRSAVLSTIWRRFRDRGITIPYPQRDVRVLERARVAFGPKLPLQEADPDRPRGRREGRSDDWLADAVEMVEAEDD